MKWDIDKSLVPLEPEQGAGTMITRVMMDVSLMKENGVKPTVAQIEKDFGLIWCAAIGVMWERKVFFYGQTIREAVLKAHKSLKLKKRKNYEAKRKNRPASKTRRASNQED